MLLASLVFLVSLAFTGIAQADCFYQVRYGDVFSRIEYRHYVTHKGLESLNSSLANRHSKRLHGYDYLKIGDRLNLGENCNYRGKKGEKVTEIARTHGVKVVALKTANPSMKTKMVKIHHKNYRVLSVNQKLVIPSAPPLTSGSVEKSASEKSIDEASARVERLVKRADGLETKVRENDDTIATLKRENTFLKGWLAKLELRVEELELPWYKQWWHNFWSEPVETTTILPRSKPASTAEASEAVPPEKPREVKLKVLDYPPAKNSNGEPQPTLLSTIATNITEPWAMILLPLITLAGVMLYQLRYSHETYGRIILKGKDEGGESFLEGIKRRRRQQKQARSRK